MLRAISLTTKDLILLSSLLLILVMLASFITCSTQLLPPPAPAAFQISKLLIVPTEVNVGEKVTITAEVINTGGTEGSYIVTLRIKDIVDRNETVTVAAGASKVVTFVIFPDAPGIYDVVVGTVSQEFTVVSEPQIFLGEVLGERKYNIEYNITLKNDGPGIVTWIQLRVPLITLREPLQRVLLAKVAPEDHKTTEDKYGNSFAEFEFINIDVGKKVSAKFTYQMAASQLQYNLNSCEEPALAELPNPERLIYLSPYLSLSPERFIESNNSDIVALSNQITQDKRTACEKTRAIYDWIVDNIIYTELDEDRGALYCLKNKCGDCTEFSCLMIALCRAAGIPARQVEGWIYTSYTAHQSYSWHDWLEVYLAGIGWVFMDPTMGSYQENRDLYFASTQGEHIILATGNPYLVAKFSERLSGYEYYCLPSVKKPNLSSEYTLQIGGAGQEL